jgi:hypothetical protein
MTVAPDDAAKKHLADLIQRYGVQLGAEPGRLAGLLKDVCGQYRMEISLLVAAAQEGIPEQLISGSQPSSSSRTGALARRLETSRGLSEANARWAVQAWSEALPTMELAPTGDGVRHDPTEAALPPPPTADQLALTKAGGGRPPRGKLGWSILAIGIALVIGALIVTRVDLLGANDDSAQSEATTSPLSRPTDSAPTDSTGPTDETGSSPTPTIVINPPRALVGTGSTSSLSSSSVSLRWTRPAHGQRPDRYIILRDGDEIARTTALTFTDNDVSWGTSHVYRVQSIAQGEISKSTNARRVIVPNPPLSEARLEGTASASMRVAYAAPFYDINLAHSATWTFNPGCGSGPCSVGWSARHSGPQLTATTGGTLSRSGSTYTGTDGFPQNSCGNNPVPTSIRITIRITAAAKIGNQWRATAFSGAMTEYTNWPAACGGNTQRTADWTFGGSLP